MRGALNSHETMVFWQTNAALNDFREDSAALSLAYASVGDDGCTAIARYMRENARKSQHLYLNCGSSVISV